MHSYQLPTSSTSFNTKVDYVNNKFNECLNNESNELLYNKSDEHLNNESHKLLDNESNKHLDNEPDEYLNEETNKQSDDGFDKQVELYEEAYTVVEAFAQSNRLGIRQGCVEKDASLQAFENGFKSLLDQYPKAAPYLNRALYPDKQCWTRAYIFYCFTASAQATSHIESINLQLQDDDNTIYIDNAFDYLLAYSLALFKQAKEQLVK
ncbi:33060_t:CDS:2, partial [Gigaspora margarita]